MHKHVLIGAICAVAAALALSVNENRVSAWNSVQCDFTTGGGWIYPTGTMAGGKGTFGVAGGCKHGSFWGHLEYHDHLLGKKIHWTSITGYQKTDDNARLICGTGRTPSDHNVTFIVRVKDRGQPGTYDEFDIQWDGTIDDYSTFLEGFPHKLAGGNILRHKPNNSNTGYFGGTCPPIVTPTTPPASDVTVEKITQTPTPAFIAPIFTADISFDIMLQNIGTATATSVGVTDNLPTGPNTSIKYTLQPTVTGCSISLATQVLTCTNLTLGAGMSLTIHVQGTLQPTDCTHATDIPPLTLTNIARVTAPGQNPTDSDPAIIFLPECTE
jgi:hypothetical protein